MNGLLWWGQAPWTLIRMHNSDNINWSVVLWLIFLVDTREWGPQKVQQELKMAIPIQGRVSDGPPGALQMHDIDFTLGFLFKSVGEQSL